MIWASLDNITAEYTIYRNEITRAVDFIKKNDLVSMPLQKHVIDDDIFVNIFEYDTKSETSCVWEAHKLYLDLHYVIEGSEIVKISDLNSMLYCGYEEEKDYVKIQGLSQTSIVLNNKGILLLGSYDAHKTGIMVEKPAYIKKAVFKIRNSVQING